DLSRPCVVEGAGVKFYLVGYVLVGINRRAASSAGISAVLLGALEDRYLSRNWPRVAWKHDIEIERCAGHLAAGHTVADADAISLPAALRTSPCRKRSRLYGL